MANRPVLPVFTKLLNVTEIAGIYLLSDIDRYHAMVCGVTAVFCHFFFVKRLVVGVYLGGGDIRLSSTFGRFRGARFPSAMYGPVRAHGRGVMPKQKTSTKKTTSWCYQDLIQRFSIPTKYRKDFIAIVETGEASTEFSFLEDTRKQS